MYRNVYLFVFFCSTLFLQGQSLEIGGIIGGSNYSGDFVPSLPFTQETKLAAGAFARFNLNKSFSVKASFVSTTLSGSDSNFENFSRNLSFRTPITELAILPEFNFNFFKKNEYLRDIRPFVFAGFSVFQFNPQTEFNGAFVDLQPLGTEGQGLPGQPSKYNLTDFAIPLGGGFKAEISQRWNIEFFANIRFTFTDYLDDLSTDFAPNFDELVNINGELAGALSSRQWEYLNETCGCTLNTPANSYIPGTQRGGEEVRDYYFTFGAAVSYKLFKFSGNNDRQKSCPKWK